MMCMKIKCSVYFINEIEQYTPSALDPDPLDNYRIRRHINNMKEEYRSFWRNSLEHSTKLEFYERFLKMNTLHPIIYTS